MEEDWSSNLFLHDIVAWTQLPNLGMIRYAIVHLELYTNIKDTVILNYNKALFDSLKISTCL